MKWEPENQISLFDNEKYLEPHHFDPEKTNPNFVYYLQAVGKRIGDPYRHVEAQKWIDARVVEFKRSHGRSEYEMLREIDGWPGKLREFLRMAAES